MLDRLSISVLLIALIFAGCLSSPRGTRIEDEDGSPSGIVELLRGTPVLPGKVAPDVLVSDLSGRKTSLKSHFSGNLTLLLFSSPFCPYSTQEHSEIQNAMGILGKGIETLTVIVKTDSESIREFLASNTVPGKIFIDDEGNAVKSYGVEMVPTILLIDGKGIVKHRANFTDTDDLVATVLRIQRGMRVVPVSTGSG